MDETQASSAANPATENETPQHSEQLAATSSSTPNGNMAEQDDSHGADRIIAAVAEPAVEAETATEQAAANADAARSAVDQTAASSDQPTSGFVSPSHDDGGTAPAVERSSMTASTMTPSSEDSTVTPSSEDSTMTDSSTASSMAADHAASITDSSDDSSVAARSDDHSTADAANSSAADTGSPATPASATGGDEIMSMEDLMRESDGRSFRALRFGDVVEGTIMHVSKDELLVDIQAKSEGIVPVNELQSLSPQELSELHVGDTILVSVVQPENNEGHAVLSLDRARQEKSWRKLQKQFENNELIETHVTGYNKGGLLVNLEGVRGFVPSSQVVGVGNDPAKQNELGGMSDRPINLKIIEINRNRNRLILSERLAMQAQRDIQKEKLLSELKPGDVKHGRVVSIADFGAFVDIGGADGLIHLSELSWSRVTNPHDVLKVGQEVDVYVLGVDENERKIALSLKRTQAEPWSDINNRYQIGQMVSGTITQLASFGAFARIADGVEGLIHISELSDNRVLHPRDVVKESDKLELRIIRIDPQRKRIGLSLKRAHEGASMEGIEDQPGDLGGEPRPPRQDRGDRGGDRGGNANAGAAAGGAQNSRFERMERAASERATGGSDRTGRDRPRRDDRRDSGPMQTTYGSTGGMTAMEQAMAAAMAAQRDGEDGDMDSNQDSSDSPRYTTQDTTGGYTSTTQDGGEGQSAPASTNHGYEVNSVTNSADNAESSASATHDSTASANNQNASRSELQESLMGSSSTGQSNAAYEQMTSGRDAADDPTSGQTPPTSDALNNRNNSQQAAAPATATEESGAGSEASIQAGEAARPATTSSVEDSEVTQHDGDTSGSR